LPVGQNVAPSGHRTGWRQLRRVPMPGEKANHVCPPRISLRGLSQATLVGCPQNLCENAIRIVVNDSCAKHQAMLGVKERAVKYEDFFTLSTRPGALLSTFWTLVCPVSSN
jgi:hypothetical protein